MKSLRFLAPLCIALFLVACEKKQDAEAPKGDKTTEETTQPPAPDTPTEAPPQAAIELPDPVATVNGKPISRAEFTKTLEEVFSMMGIQSSALPQDQLAMLYRQFAEDMVIDRLVDEAAASTEITDQELDEEITKISQQYGSKEQFLQELNASGQSFDSFNERLKKLLRQRKWMQSQMTDVVVEESEARDFYDKNKQEFFEQPAMVKASHILIRVDENADQATVEAKQKQAAELAEKARKGEDFGKLAEQFSDDPTAKQNKGDLSYFPKDRMVPEFAETAFSQEVGTISDPVRTIFGWHVIKVTDRKPAETKTFDEVKKDITAYLKESREQQAADKIISRLREQAKVEIFLPQPKPSDFSLPPDLAPDSRQSESTTPSTPEQPSAATTEPLTLEPAASHPTPEDNTVPAHQAP